MLISIVIPTLNEATCIAHALENLQKQAHPFEVIVADGGSTDGTRAIAAPHATVIETERGRANQMNAGAAVANGEVLLFLHADTFLPGGALDLIRASAAKGARSGNFRLKFDITSPLLNFYSFFTRFKLRRFSFGDRGLFVQSSVFRQMGGFAAIPIFEDLEIVRRLHQRGGFVFLQAYVTTAARRFEKNGFLNQQLLNSYLWLRYLMGTPPSKLARLYKYEKDCTEEPVIGGEG